MNSLSYITYKTSMKIQVDKTKPLISLSRISLRKKGLKLWESITDPQLQRRRKSAAVQRDVCSDSAIQPIKKHPTAGV